MSNYTIIKVPFTDAWIGNYIKYDLKWITALETSRQHHILTAIFCVGIVRLAVSSLRNMEM
jgi:hypothetical protein